MLVHDFLIHSANKHPDNTAVVHGKDRLTYIELHRLARNIAAHLLEQGLASGERVAILSDKPQHYIASYFGVLLAGGIVVGLNTQTSTRSLEYTITDCSPVFICVSGSGKKYSAFLQTLSPNKYPTPEGPVLFTP